jgi:CelD/BcsL family acetyltransferase involved in cellulose biosynthesis
MDLKEEWNKLLERSATNTVFQTWEWNQLWWKHFGPSEGLLLLIVRNSTGELLGIAPFFCDQEVDKQKRIKFLGGTDLSDYLDFIVCRGKEPLVYPAIANFLISHPDFWDTIELHCLPEGSPTLDVFRACWGEERFRESLSTEDVCPRAQLSASWNEFLASMSQKERHEIRRKINKIQREAEDFRYVATDSTGFPEAIESFLELHRKSDTGKMVFMSLKRAEFFREMAWTLLREGWLDLSFLEGNHRKLASLLNFTYRGTVYVYNSGYDPDFGHWSPGWVLISYSIQDAIERGMRIYDFLRGRESYKYRFRAKDFEIFRYTIQRREE